MTGAVLVTACGSAAKSSARKTETPAPTPSSVTATTSTERPIVSVRLAAAVTLGPGAKPDVLLPAFGAVWVEDGDSPHPQVARIDPNTDNVVASIKTPTAPLSLYQIGPDVWLNAQKAVYRIDPTTNRITATLSKVAITGDSDAFVGVGAGSIWLGSRNKLYRVDAQTQKVVAVITTPFPAGRANGDDSMIWLSQANFSSQGTPTRTTSIARIDPRTNKVVAIVAAPNNDHVRVGTGGVWVSDRLDSLLYHVDPTTNRVTAKIPATLGITIPEFGLGYVWIGGDSATSVEQVDPQTNKVVRSIPVPTKSNAEAIAIMGKTLWASSYGNGIVYRFNLR
jgi:hypothetical protein